MDKAVWRNLCRLSPQICGLSLLILLPLIHFGVIRPLAPVWYGEDFATPEIWQDPSVVQCTCNCSGQIQPDNRHFHLRPTRILSSIFLITILFTITVYELMNRAVKLYQIGQLRSHFGVAILMNFHSMYRTYWILVTLYNHEFFYQFYYRLLQCVMHLAQVAILAQACDQRTELGWLQMIVLLKTSLCRMLVALKAQIDMYLWYGYKFQLIWVIPDVFFFLSDVLAALVCVEELVFMATKRGLKLKSILCSKPYCLGATIFFCIVIFAGEFFPEN